MKPIAEAQLANRKSSEEWPLKATQKVKSKSNKKGTARKSSEVFPYPNTYQFLSLRLQRAFHQLRGRGYECFADLLCCQSCALAVIHGDRYVFWHAQDADIALRDDTLMLAWCGEPDVIIDSLQATGLIVEWDGNSAHRIAVRLPQAGEGAAS